MTSADRKIKRKKENSVYKSFNKSIKSMRKMIVCSECGRTPEAGEMVDDWKITVLNGNIKLVCVGCSPEDTSDEN